jgi:hypothetical protein
VLAFGLGSLLIASILGFAMVSLAEGVLPPPKETTSTPRKGEAKDVPAKPNMLKPGPKSKTPTGDANKDDADEPAEEAEQPL